MANINIITLGELAKSKNEVIKRNAISIKTELRKLEEEFYQLRNDDPDFAISYGREDYPDWLIEQGLIGDNALHSR